MTQAQLAQISLVTSIFLQLLVFILLIRRHLNRRLLWFFIYIVFQICEAAVRFSGSGNNDLYAKVYWATDLADMVMGIVAFRESFLNTFRPYTRLRWFLKTIWLGVGLALAYAAFRAWYLPSLFWIDREILMVNINVAVDYSLSVVGILYLAFVAFLRIKEYRWESVIILGFTVNHIISSFGYVSFLKTRFGPLSRWLPALGYLLGATIWAVGLWRPEPAVVAPVKNLHEKDLELLNRYATIMDLIFKRKR
jgi:hypothetical protein